MEKGTVLEIILFQFHRQYAQVVTKVTEMETVLSHLNQSYATLDLSVMDQEAAFQL